MNILVTGGLGNIGSCLCNVLSENNDVIILDNFSNNTNNIKADNVNIVKGDVRDNIVNDLASKVDIIVHMAAQISVDESIERPIYDADVNINGTLNILEAARKFDVERLIYISSAAVYGIPNNIPIKEDHTVNPISPYGLSKLTGERYSMLYHELYGLPIVCFRPFNIFGPNQNLGSPYSGVISKFIAKIKRDETPLIFGDGNQIRDFVYIDDVVTGIIKSINNDKAVGEIFNIGTGNKTMIKDLAEIIIKISDKELRPEFLPSRTGDIKDSCADITKARKILEWEPRYTVENGLKLCYNSVRNI